jgi:hypothetical protein
MPLQEIRLMPGINRESTSYANKGGYYAGDKIRFRSGFPGKIGGWQSLSNPTLYTYNGVCRLLWNWVTTASENLIAVGTNQKFYVNYGGQYYDITPVNYSTTLAAAPFSVTSGSPLVTVTASGHGATAGTWVTFSGASSVGGLTLNSAYEIIQVVDGNTYTIIAGSNASSTTTGGGSSVLATYQINAGGATYTSGNGWGAGGWGVSGWGSGSTSGVGIGQQLRLWSAVNYGQDLIFAPALGAIYYWAKNTSTFPAAVTLASLANATTAGSTTLAAGFSSGVSTITVTNGTGISAGSVITGTGIAAGTYVTTSYITGSTSVPLSANTTGSGTLGSVITFSYAGKFVPTETDGILVSDASEFVLAFGANPYDPTNFSTTYNPMLIRWSDQGNAYQWVPSATNQSGEQALSHGSYILTAFQARQEILVWTDTALYSLQYVGPPYVWSVQLLMDNVSMISPNAAWTINNVTYWMGNDRFFFYNGTVQTLPCALRQFIYTDINWSQSNQIVAGGNEGYNEVWWHYPTADSQVNNRYVVYNYLDNVWYYGSMNRTAWLDSPLQNYPIAAFSVQTSYIYPAINATVTSIALINGYSYPSSGTVVIGSEQITYTGIDGNTLTGCVRGANGTTAASHEAYTQCAYSVGNQILNHEVGNDDNSTLTTLPIYAYVESSDFDVESGDHFGFVWRMIPDVSFLGSTSSTPSVRMGLFPRTASGANYQNAPDLQVLESASQPVEQYTELIYTRVRGRQMMLRVSSSDLGVAWELGAVRVDYRKDGRR